nr:hypothetical protein [Tanacetum cinerariifolium]
MPSCNSIVRAFASLGHDLAFQTEDLDAYDSDCDDISLAKVVLMVNLLSSDSDVLSKVPYSDTYLNDMINQDVRRYKSTTTTTNGTTRSPQMVSFVKLPILKKGEYILWTMKMKQYLAHTDYTVWEVILNGNGKVQMTKDEAGNKVKVSPVTTHTSNTNELNPTYSGSTATCHSSQEQGSSSYVDELMFSFFANQSSSPQLDNEDIEQINQDDLEEMDLKWQLVLTKPRLSYFNYHRRGHFARDCRTSRNPRNKGRDAGNVGYRGRDNGKRPVREEDEKALVVQDGLGTYDWSYQLEEEATDFTLLAFTSNPSSSNSKVLSCSKQRVQSYEQLKNLFDEKYEKLRKANLEIIGYQYGLESIEGQLRLHQQNKVIYEEKIRVLEDDVKDKKEEVTETVFDNRSSDEENSLANDRFKKGEGYHVVPPLLTGNYMPPKPDLSFAGLDDSNYKFTISETVTSLTKNVKDAPKSSTAFVEKPKEVRNNRMAKKSMLPNNVEMGTGHKKSRPVRNNVQRINHQNKFAPTRVFTRSRRIPISAAKPKVAASTSAAKPINTAGPKQSVNFSKSRSTFHKSNSPIRRYFYNAIAHSKSNSTEKVNIAGSKAVSAVKGNGVTAIKALAGCVWRPRVNEIDQISKDNRCSGHMTGNKAYLADYQEINDGVALVEGRQLI